MTLAGLRHCYDKRPMKSSLNDGRGAEAHGSEGWLRHGCQSMLGLKSSPYGSQEAANREQEAVGHGLPPRAGPRELLPPKSLLLHCLSPPITSSYDSTNGSVIRRLGQRSHGLAVLFGDPSRMELEVFINPIKLAVKIDITIFQHSPPQHQCQRKQGHLCPATLEAAAPSDGPVVMPLASPLTRLARCVSQTLRACL